MTSIPLIEASVSDSDDVLAGLPPLLTRVPLAGPPVWVAVGFGGVLLFLLVPPLALVVTLMAVALIVALAVGALVALVALIVMAPFRIARLVREQRLPHISLSVPHLSHLTSKGVKA